MWFLPFTVCLALAASLLVAFTVNPTLASTFMKVKDKDRRTGGDADEINGWQGFIGGFIVNRAERLERTIGLAMTLAATLLLVTSLGWVNGYAAAAITALAGFGTGLAGPSRDMLIKRAAPPGATGRVYGTVYSGLDLGFALAAPIFGAFMDHGHPQGVFWGAAIVLIMGVASATLVGQGLRPRST